MLTRISATRYAVLAALIGGLACAPAFAADQAPSAPKPQPKHHEMMNCQKPPEAMRAHVEERIQTLHEKLGITAEQEEAWTAVAKVMRDNESEIGGLIKTRHEKSETRTAIEDLESFQKIAQAHADGLGKMVDAFSKLYDGMSDAQKANADKVFGTFEGHRFGHRDGHEGRRHHEGGHAPDGNKPEPKK